MLDIGLASKAKKAQPPWVVERQAPLIGPRQHEIMKVLAGNRLAKRRYAASKSEMGRQPARQP